MPYVGFGRNDWGGEDPEGELVVTRKMFENHLGRSFVASRFRHKGEDYTKA